MADVGEGECAGPGAANAGDENKKTQQNLNQKQKAKPKTHDVAAWTR